MLLRLGGPREVLDLELEVVTVEVSGTAAQTSGLVACFARFSTFQSLCGWAFNISKSLWTSLRRFKSRHPGSPKSLTGRSLGSRPVRVRSEGGWLRRVEVDLLGQYWRGWSPVNTLGDHEIPGHPQEPGAIGTSFRLGGTLTDESARGSLSIPSYISEVCPWAWTATKFSGPPARTPVSKPFDDCSHEGCYRSLWWAPPVLEHLEKYVGKKLR